MEPELNGVWGCGDTDIQPTWLRITYLELIVMEGVWRMGESSPRSWLLKRMGMKITKRASFQYITNDDQDILP